jgi:hypothetical protein
VGLQADVPGLRGRRLHLLGGGEQAIELPGLHERERQLGQQLQAARVVRGQQRGGPREQVDRGGHVAAGEGALARRGQARGRALAQRRGAVVGGAELEQRAMRLLEVVADDLLVLAREVLRVDVQPVGQALVHLRPPGLGDPAVGGVADQDVGEAEGVLPADLGAVGADELLAHERLQRARDPRPDVGRRELGDRAPPERPPDDRCALGDRALLGLQAIQAGREQRVDGGRDRDPRQVVGERPAPVELVQDAVVDQHPDGLLDEQRVALGHLGDPRPRLDGHLRAAHEAADEAVGLRLGQRREGDRRRVGLGRHPVGADVEQLRARLADDQHRGALDPVGEVVEQVEERGLAPVDVVEGHDERPAGGEALEEAADRPVGLLQPDVGGAQAEQRPEPVADELIVGGIGRGRRGQEL